MNNLEKAIKLVEDKISSSEEIVLDLWFITRIQDKIRLRVILENGNLEPRFANQQFFRQIPRPDGSYNIPLPTIRTTILEKET